MATEPRQIPGDPSSDAARRRLNIHGIKEMPAGYDAEVAELFRDLRAASNLSETDLAARLGTRMEVVQALEQGALYALPPWPETCRIVNGYGALLHLDVRPLLRRIYAQLEAGIVELQPKTMPDVPTMNTPEAMDFGYGANWGAPPPPQAPRPSPQQAYPQPQNQWPGAPPPAPAQYQPPQPQYPQQPQANRHPQPRPVQAHAPQPHPQPPLAPQPQPASPLDVEFPVVPTAEKPKRKSALLKWGLVALIVSLIAFGLWMALGSLPESGSQTSTSPDSAPVLDPDDPRSRKSDRLPSQF
jgi:transcriptional regulator with XRE-family HTH domain